MAGGEVAGYDRLAEAMMAEGLFQVRYYIAGHFSVELNDGRKGVGQGIRSAIEAAKAKAKGDKS